MKKKIRGNKFLLPDHRRAQAIKVHLKWALSIRISINQRLGACMKMIPFGSKIEIPFISCSTTINPRIKMKIKRNYWKTNKRKKKRKRRISNRKKRAIYVVKVWNKKINPSLWRSIRKDKIDTFPNIKTKKKNPIKRKRISNLNPYSPKVKKKPTS